MTQTEICNKALSHLAEAEIADYSENTVLARKCRVHYEVERDALLRMHRWNFAKERVDLVATDPVPTFGWDYRYDLPDDPYCLRVLSVNGVEADLPEVDFEIEGRSLLCDDYGVSLVYIAQVTDSTLHDPLFNLAFAAKLGAALCLELTGSQQKKQAILAEFSAIMREAGWVDAVEDRNRVIPAWSGSRVVAARSGTAGYNQSY